MPIIHRLFTLLALLFSHAMSNSDVECRWHNTVEFWSSVVCTMENFKTVNFHVAPDNKRSIVARHFERCFEAFVHGVARKCEATIVSRTYASRYLGNASFIGFNNAVHRVVSELPSIWKIASGDAIASRRDATATEEGIGTQRNRIYHGENTWNVHVILARDIRFLDQISKNDSMFEWMRPHDRFIVLISRQDERPRDSDLTIDDVLRTLWRRRNVQSVFAAEMTPNDDTTTRIVRTYNPFVKVNDSAWGKIEVINVRTAMEASIALSHLKYRRTRNLNHYELKVGIFTKGETINNTKARATNHYKSDSDIFKGFDDLMLNTVATHMNFKANITDPTDNQNFGYRLPNGTYIGALGDVIYGRTDVCTEAFFIKKYGISDQEDIEFSTYVDFDRVCVFVPKAFKIPKGLRIYHLFPLSIWVLTVAMYVLTVVTWYFLQVLTPGRTRNVSFCKTFYRLLMLNICPQKLPKSNAERILLSVVLLANVTMVGIFGGILYNSFAHDMYYRDINTLEELDSSGLPLTLTSLSLNDLFGPENNTDLPHTMQNLRKKMIYGPDSLQRAACYRNVSGFVKESYYPIIKEEYFDASGGHLVHLVNECPGGYYLAYLFPKQSVLRERINTVIGRLNQAGLPTLWKNNHLTLYMLKKLALKKEKIQREIEQDDFVPFDLSDMQSSFYMLLIGLSISTVVFFHEKGWIKLPLP